MMSKRWFVMVIGVILLPMAANAAIIYEGSRTSPAGQGVYAYPPTGPWDNGGFKIEWTITQKNPGDWWDYVYKITTSRKELSHWILEVSQTFSSDQIKDIKINGTPAGVEGPKKYDSGLGNPGMPGGGIWGIKFDALSGYENTFSFSSKRRPVWGDFYAKDGVIASASVYAYNAGFGTDPVAGTTDFTPWILTPDTAADLQEIPEAGTLALCGLGCLGLLVMGRRRK